MTAAHRDANRPPGAGIDLRRADTQNCPYAAYDRLREEAPVWRDPNSGFFVISRYDILKEVLLDTERFSNVFSACTRTIPRSRFAKRAPGGFATKPCS